MSNIHKQDSNDDSLERSQFPNRGADRIETTCQGNVQILKFSVSSLNYTVTDRLKEELKTIVASAYDSGAKRFVLDMSNVKIIDSCGISLIIIAHNSTSARNAKLALANVKPFIRKIFEIMRIDKHLTVCDSVDEAIKAVGDV